MANLNTVDVDLANLNIMDEEEDPLVVVGDDIAIDPKYELCLVGRVLTDSIMNFLSLKNTLADLWHPLRRVSITKIEDKRILFQFYSEIDLKRVMDGNQQADFGWDLSLRATPRRGGQLPVDLKIEDSMGQIEEMGDGLEPEDMLVEFVDGKKRQ
ncbi:hypothetical protein Goshw_002133 [Gossypium schwendimanii]|uniref:DUF4283 domain-containing protein n=1 Tax=Gossypium schwendimanii TaxID=34291 RepID=A0A7J9MNG1_GOSSC|nr:hypothetical protein [Gossypium schwendimanii]